MKALIEQANRIARARVEAVIDTLIAAAGSELPRDVRVERERDGLSLRGRALRLRSIVDARLRGFARWLR